ncbi:hypothetical protein Tco_0280706 [Tanacetum coccineum]
MEKIVLIKQRIQSAQDRQKSYADLKRKPMEFKVGERCYAQGLTLERGCTIRFAGTLGEVLNSPGNAKIRSNKNTHSFSQTGLRHPLQGLKL